MADEVQKRASKGGLARAANLSPEKRREIAIAAAETRWGNKLPVAQYPGVVKLAGLEFPCAVLADDPQTRVLTETDFMRVMGMYRSGALSVRRPEAEEGGAREPLYLAFKNLKPFIDRHLGDVHQRTLTFRTLSGNIAQGIPADILSKICEVWIDAKAAGVLGPRQIKIAAKADILLRGLATVGITALIDEATGFQDQRPKDALARILEAFVQDELRKWVRTFPAQYYEELCRLKGIGYPPQDMKLPRYFGLLTNDIVYDRLAPGVKAKLKSLTPRDEKGRHKQKLFQRLTDDIGDPRLREHLSSVVTLMKISPSYDVFQQHLDKVHPRWDDTLPLNLM